MLLELIHLDPYIDARGDGIQNRRQRDVANSLRGYTNNSHCSPPASSGAEETLAGVALKSMNMVGVTDTNRFAVAFMSSLPVGF